jgi:hypothetical protein
MVYLMLCRTLFSFKQQSNWFKRTSSTRCSAALLPIDRQISLQKASNLSLTQQVSTNDLQSHTEPALFILMAANADWDAFQVEAFKKAGRQQRISAKPSKLSCGDWINDDDNDDDEVTVPFQFVRCWPSDILVAAGCVVNGHHHQQHQQHEDGDGESVYMECRNEHSKTIYRVTTQGCNNTG